MSNSEKKAYLRQYIDAGRRARRLLEEIEAQRALMVSVRALTYDDMPHGSGDNTADLANIVVKIEALFRDLQKEVDHEMEVRQRIASDINRMGSETEKNVLYYRYILGMKWETVANKMHLAERWVFEIHGRALEHFEIHQ